MHGNAKHFKPNPKASQGPSCDVRTIDVNSNASDGHSAASAISTSSFDEDSLHNAIIRILPRVQPGLFPTEICDQLSEKHPDLWEKYRSFSSFKTMIHHTLTAMLKEKKVDRQNAMTENLGRSHQYVTLVQSEPVRSHRTQGAGIPNSKVDLANSYSKASTVSPITAPQRQVQTEGSKQASPKTEKTTTNPHTAVPCASTATSRDEKTHSRPTEKSSETASKAQTTPQASATDQQSKLVRGSGKEREKCTQPRALEPASSSVRMPSSRPSIGIQSVRPLTRTPGHNSERPGQVLPTNSDDHFMLSAEDPQGTQKTEVLAAGERHALPARSSLPLISCNRDPAPKPASSKSLSKEPLSGSRVIQRAEMEAPVSRDPLLNREKAPDERTSISDNITNSGETEETPLSPKAPSRNVPLQGQTGNAAFHAQKPPTAEAHLQMSRSSSAQSRTRAPVNADTQDPPSLAGSSARSGGLSIPESQSRPSFTAINPITQPEVGSSTMSASTQTTAITALAPLRDRTSESTPVRKSNAEGNGQNALERSEPRSRPNVPDISNSSIGLPEQPSRPGLYPPPQRTGQDSPTKVTQSNMAPVKQAKQSQGLRSPGQIQQNPLGPPLGGCSGPSSTGHAQQTVTMDLTNISQADESSSRPTHIHASYQTRGTLELGTMAKRAIEVAQKRREYGNEAKLLETRRHNAESRLDELLKRMNAQMKNLSDIHKGFEGVRKKFAEQEAEVARKVNDIREQADRTRATADQVTSECRKYDESKTRAEREFANADKEWRGLVQALGIF